jgi:hypothetical protein
MFDSPEARPMFAISLALVVLISSAILLYQFWSGTLAGRDADGTLTELHPEARDERSAPARAA